MTEHIFKPGDKVGFNVTHVPYTKILTSVNYPIGGTVRIMSGSPAYIMLEPGLNGKEYVFSPNEVYLTLKVTKATNVWPDPPDMKHHGHPRFYEILDDLTKLHSEKNHDYAAGGKATGNFDRVAKILSQYPKLDLSSPTVVSLVYLLKQLDATLWMLSNKHTAKVEGVIGRLQDVMCYSGLSMILYEEENKGKTTGGGMTK